MMFALFDSGRSFFEVPRIVRDTSVGPIEFPILYRDASALMAYFRVSPERAGDVLADTGLAPVRFGAHALVGLALFEYRETSIGPYNEVGLSLPVHPAGEPAPAHPVLDMCRSPRRRRTGLYILDLPVTTEAARAAGVEIWGLPKFVTDLPIHFERRHFDGAVMDPAGGSILRLWGRPGAGLPLPGADLTLISRRDGDWLHAVVDVRATWGTGSGGRLRLELGDSEHRMAGHLRALGLDGARPDLVQRTTHFRSRLHLPMASPVAAAA